MSAVHPYLFFEGRAEEALEFYKKALGAEITLIVRIGDSPGSEAHIPPGNENKLLHADFRIGASTIGASDGFCSGQPKFEGVRLVLTCADKGEAETKFAALAAGGQIHQPLSATFFSPAFGMLADQFGVPWMVYSTENK
jgi:PhnB protein